MSSAVGRVQRAVNYCVAAGAYEKNTQRYDAQGESSKATSGGYHRFYDENDTDTSVPDNDACVRRGLYLEARRFSWLPQTAKMVAVRAVIGAGVATAMGTAALGGAVLGVGYTLTHRVVKSIDRNILSACNCFLVERFCSGAWDNSPTQQILRYFEGALALYAVSALTGCALLGVPALVTAVYIAREPLASELSALAVACAQKISFKRDLQRRIVLLVFCLVVKCSDAAACTLGLKVALVAAVKFGAISASAASLPVSVPFGLAMGAVGVGMAFFSVVATSKEQRANFSRYLEFLKYYV